MKVLVASALFIALFAACRQSDGQKPATVVATTVSTSQGSSTTPLVAGSPTPRPTRPPTRLDFGPYPQATAMAIRRYDSVLILDVASKDIFVVRNAWTIQQWIDDDTPSTAQGPQIDLRDSQITYDPPYPTATPPMPPPVMSADGEWRLEVGSDGAFVADTSGSRRLDLPIDEFRDRLVQAYAWSPGGALLAIGGGRCGADPLLLVDPNAESIVQLYISVVGASAKGYVWRPDSAAIAVGIGRTSEPRLVLYDIVAGTQETLIDAGIGASGELLPGEWSPSGARLKFSIYQGRPCPY